MLAALSWCGANACLSHLSAAAVVGWIPMPDVVHLTTTDRHGSRPGITVHRTERLPASHVQHWVDLRVTVRSRTLVDLADVLEYDDLRRVADQLPRLPVLTSNTPSASSPGGTAPAGSPGSSVARKRTRSRSSSAATWRTAGPTDSRARRD